MKILICTIAFCILGLIVSEQIVSDIARSNEKHDTRAIVQTRIFFPIAGVVVGLVLGTIIHVATRNKRSPGIASASNTSTSESIETRIRQLDDLRSKNVITATEYDQRRNALLQQI